MTEADIRDLRWVPFLFKGGYPDFSAGWYSEFGNGFIQVAAVNAVVFPLMSLFNPYLWRLQTHVMTRRVKTQREMNRLYCPPKFLLSERYGPFHAALVYTVMLSSSMPVLYAVMVLWCVLQLVVDRLALLRHCAAPPRYTGKLAAMLIHTVPVAVILHFAVAVYVFGERSLPSWTIGSGTSGRWSGAEDGRSGGVVREDGQFDMLARVMRVNGLVPTVGLISVAAFMVIGYAVVGLGGSKRTAWAEGCPPLRQAMARGVLTGLASYHITANPDYRQLFPPGDEVTDGL